MQQGPLQPGPTAPVGHAAKPPCRAVWPRGSAWLLSEDTLPWAVCLCWGHALEFWAWGTAWLQARPSCFSGGSYGAGVLPTPPACLPAHRACKLCTQPPSEEMSQQPEALGRELWDTHTRHLLRHAGYRPDLSRTFLTRGVGSVSPGPVTFGDTWSMARWQLHKS